MSLSSSTSDLAVRRGLEDRQRFLGGESPALPSHFFLAAGAGDASFLLPALLTGVVKFFPPPTPSVMGQQVRRHVQI